MTNNPAWKPAAIIFDMDGLLVDSETVWYLAEAEMLEARGHHYTEESRMHIVGLRQDEFLAKLSEYFRLEDSVEALTAEVNKRMIELIPQLVRPQPGAVEILDYVQRSRIPCAVASSSPKVIINAIMQAQGWDEALAVRCSGEEVPRGKPAPDVYVAAARRLNIDPVDCLALEDSANGARAAVAAGMVCYAVPDLSHATMSAFAGITPYVFESLHDVLAVLKA